MVGTYEYENVHTGFRADYAPAVLLAIVGTYMLSAGELAGGLFFVVVALLLYNALKPDTTSSYT
ncbi:hypothetical protein KJ765_05385 [Candidatus Micrarchaeota archaeon]|nr:hypothetical protein [Candidatus Micrarchaeota archaeon]